MCRMLLVDQNKQIFGFNQTIFLPHTLQLQLLSFKTTHGNIKSEIYLLNQFKAELSTLYQEVCNKVEGKTQKVTFPLFAATPQSFRTVRKTLSVKRLILMAWCPPSAVSCFRNSKRHIFIQKYYCSSEKQRESVILRSVGFNSDPTRACTISQLNGYLNMSIWVALHRYPKISELIKNGTAPKKTFLFLRCGSISHRGKIIRCSGHRDAVSDQHQLTMANAI